MREDLAEEGLADGGDGSVVVEEASTGTDVGDSTAMVLLEELGRGGDEGEVHDDVCTSIEPRDGLVEEGLLLSGGGGGDEGELGDDDLLVGEATVCVLDVGLELADVGSVPVEVDIVVVASSVADVQEVLEPVKPLTRVGRGGDSRKSLPDSHRVNVLEVPIDGLLRGDVVEVGLIEREHIRPSLLAPSVVQLTNRRRCAVLLCLSTDEVDSGGPSRPPSLPVVHPGHLPAIREPSWVDVLALVEPRVCETSLGLGGDDAREGGGDSEDGKLHGRC